MTAGVLQQRWPVAREALGEAAKRFADLLRKADGLDARAVGGWSAAEAAAHVVAIGRMYEAMVRGEVIPIEGVQEGFPRATIGNLKGLNDLTLAAFTERDPARLADQITADVASMLRHTENDDPARPIEWLGDSRVPLVGLFSHLVNELFVHGADVAGATGMQWEISNEAAALFSEVFVVWILRYDIGRLQETIVRPPRRRIAVAFTSAYTEPFALVWDGTRLVAGEPGQRADLRIRFEPATLNLMLFRRVSKLRAILTGKVVVRGRLWLLPGFLRVVRMP